VRGARQEAFQIVVKGVDSGAVLWDSGKVENEESRHVPFGSVGRKVSKQCRLEPNPMPM
jgi:hypothetical protein